MNTLEALCHVKAGRPSKPKAVTTHRVSIEPAMRNAHRQYFTAYMNGQQIVEKSPDPEFAACRALAAMGLSGRAEFYVSGAKYPGLVVRDLRKAARLCVIETDSVNASIKKWKPFHKGSSSD